MTSLKFVVDFATVISMGIAAYAAYLAKLALNTTEAMQTVSRKQTISDNLEKTVNELGLESGSFIQQPDRNCFTDNEVHGNIIILNTVKNIDGLARHIRNAKRLLKNVNEKNKCNTAITDLEQFRSTLISGTFSKLNKDFLKVHNLCQEIIVLLDGP